MRRIPDEKSASICGLFAGRVHPFPMNVTAAFLTLCVRDAEAVLTMDFWTVRERRKVCVNDKICENEKV